MANRGERGRGESPAVEKNQLISIEKSGRERARERVISNLSRVRKRTGTSRRRAYGRSARVESIFRIRASCATLSSPRVTGGPEDQRRTEISGNDLCSFMEIFRAKIFDKLYGNRENKNCGKYLN